jgi:hypothetical protein
MNYTIDYPNIRASEHCPMCGRDKDQGLLVCWPCYRLHNVRNGLDQETIYHFELIENQGRQAQ